MKIIMKCKNVVLFFVMVTLISSCQSIDPQLGKFFENLKLEEKLRGVKPTNQGPTENIGETKNGEANSIKFKPFLNENAKDNISLAVLSYPSYLGAEKNIDTALAAVEGVRSIKELQATANILAGVKAEDNVTDPAANLSISLNKLIYDYGASDASVLSAEDRLQIAKIESLIVAESIALKGYEAWIDLIRKKQIFAIYSEGLELAEPLLGKIKNISSSGIADKSDLLDAQKRYSSLELAVAEISSMVISSEAAFLDIFPGSNINSVRPLTMPNVNIGEESSVGLVRTSKALKINKLLVQSLNSEINALERGAKPTISLASNVNAPAKNTRNDGIATIGLNLSYQFNDGGKRDSDISSLKSQIESVRHEIDKQILQDKTRLALLEQQLEVSLKRIVSSKEMVSLTKDIRDTAKGQLISGRSSISDVMNAEVSLAEAEISLVNAEADARLASFGIIGLVDGILTYINWKDQASN